jgi:hypothetical protein
MSNYLSYKEIIRNDQTIACSELDENGKVTNKSFSKIVEENKDFLDYDGPECQICYDAISEDQIYAQANNSFGNSIYHPECIQAYHLISRNAVIGTNRVDTIYLFQGFDDNQTKVGEFDLDEHRTKNDKPKKRKKDKNKNKLKKKIKDKNKNKNKIKGKNKNKDKKKIHNGNEYQYLVDESDDDNHLDPKMVDQFYNNERQNLTQNPTINIINPIEDPLLDDNITINTGNTVPKWKKLFVCCA